MPRFTLAFVASIVVAGSALAQPLPTEGPVKPKEVRAIYANGKHNAFTAFRKWKGAYWIAFRQAASHNSADGDLVLLKSTDMKKWTEAKRFNILPDDRDPQMVATEKRLFLYDPAMKGPALTSYVTYTDDGSTWSEPQPVYEPRFILWKPIVHDGRFWSAAHVKAEGGSGGKERAVHLIASDDGLKWEKVSQVRAGNWESETTLLMQGTKAIGFLRQKYGSPPAAVLEAEAPYKEWKARPAPINHFSGHSVHTFKGVTYLLTRTMDYGGKRQAGQAIYTYEKDGSLKLYCVLPAGRDCAYAEAVEEGDDMLVSYYSGHETGSDDKCNIYLAVVPLRK